MEKEEIKIIEDISLIYDGEKLLVKDFSNMDLSKLDLSIIPGGKWKNCVFHNTNFSGTNIKFNPQYLKKFKRYEWSFDRKYMYNSIICCNFEGCDLSYLKPENMEFVKGGGV